MKKLPMWCNNINPYYDADFYSIKHYVILRNTM